MKKYKVLLLLFVAVLIPNIKVDAATVQNKLCCGSKGLYSITFDDSVSTAVTVDKINCDNVADGHLAYPNGVEDAKYKFSAAKIASQCVNNNGEIISCPKNSNTLSTIKSTYIKDDASLTDKVNIEFNGSGKFNVRIKNVFGNKYKIRFTPNDETKNTTLTNGNAYNDFLSANGNGEYVLMGLDPNQAVGLEFYQNDNSDGCNGAFIGGIVFFTPDLTTVKVTNPALTDATYGCTSFYNWKPTNFTNKNYDTVEFNNLKKDIVNLCYDREIKYTELANLHSDVLSSINSFKSLFEGIEVVQAGGGNKCQQSYTGNTKVTSWTGSYWAYTCVENYSASGDAPKLVHAGDGFSYVSTFTVTRSCQKRIINPQKHYTPQYCPVPIYCEDCSCDCTWTGASGQEHTGSEAGPNDTFDQCVKNCDGGKYSQKCINSCYKQTYKKSRDLSFSSAWSTKDRVDNKAIFVADYSAQNAAAGGLVTTASGYTSHNLPGVVYTMKINDRKSCSCTESYWCQGGHGSCTFHTWLYVCGTDTAYCGEVEARSDAEESYVDAAIAEPINVDTSKFRMTITDTYLRQGANSRNPLLTTTYTTATNPALNVSYTANSSIAVATVSLPLSYINRVTGEATYKSNESSSTGYKMNPRRSVYEAVAFGNNVNDLANYFYTPGERKYYTSVLSEDYNVGYKEDGTVGFSNNINYNIAVTSGTNGSGAMGWAKFGSNISCYYGVYNEYYADKEKKVCDPLTEVCDGGIQFIFRPIVIGDEDNNGDVFPNGRDPRFNWTAKAKMSADNRLYHTVVDPVTYTKNIENKRDTIYNESSGEIDYEFILTPKNIAAIKTYNKTVEDFNKDGDKNYLDYDLSCYNANGRDMCTSRFLDNTDIVTYSGGHTVDSRKSIARCNNAKENGTACDTSAHE